MFENSESLGNNEKILSFNSGTQISHEAFDVQFHHETLTTESCELSIPNEYTYESAELKSVVKNLNGKLIA
jgi:hypothetical protein